MLPFLCAVLLQGAEAERHPGDNTPFPHPDLCVQDRWLIKAIRLMVPEQWSGVGQGMWQQLYQ